MAVTFNGLYRLSASWPQKALLVGSVSDRYAPAANEDRSMPHTKLPKLIFSLNAAREMAEKEGPQADLLTYLIEQALSEAKAEASRRGIAVDLDQAPGKGHSWMPQ